MKIGILGVGNMGGAIAGGYARAAASRPAAGHAPAEIFICDSDTAKVDALCALPGVTPAPTIRELVEQSDAIILAVKPNAMGELLPRIAGVADEVGGRPRVFVSIAAGISIAYLTEKLSASATNVSRVPKIIRVMPNTPAMVGEGMSALARNDAVTDEEFAAVFSVFESIGCAVEVTEEQIHAVIGLSGSSPAYAYMYIQALIEDGVRHGLSEETARLLAAQSTLGAAKMVLESDLSAEQLRINVCSPGGTTIEAVDLLLERGFIDLVGAASDAAIAKSKSMTK